jgi:hypothetical protein
MKRIKGPSHAGADLDGDRLRRRNAGNLVHHFIRARNGVYGTRVAKKRKDLLAPDYQSVLCILRPRYSRLKVKIRVLLRLKGRLIQPGRGGSRDLHCGGRDVDRERCTHRDIAVKRTPGLKGNDEISPLKGALGLDRNSPVRRISRVKRYEIQARGLAKYPVDRQIDNLSALNHRRFVFNNLTAKQFVRVDRRVARRVGRVDADLEHLDNDLRRIAISAVASVDFARRKRILLLDRNCAGRLKRN